MATMPAFNDDEASPPNEAALAYDTVGAAYVRYADGEDPASLDFSSRYGFADREIWRRIDAELIALRTAGRSSVRIIDAGCGPGTWLIRVVLRARALGFTAIEGRGFDISPAMVSLAVQAAAEVRDPAIRMSFQTADLADAFAGDDPVDIVLCLYGVMNHLPRSAHAEAAKALTAAGRSLFVTVRTVGSLPSIFVTGMESARDFRQDNDIDRLEIDLVDGRHLGFSSHLFSADEFTSLFAPHGRIVERLGLDLFHGRFATDSRWNPASLPNRGFDEALVRLEHLCASDPCFLDRAAHILLHLRSKAVKQ